jgi:hypothetical protein
MTYSLLGFGRFSCPHPLLQRNTMNYFTEYVLWEAPEVRGVGNRAHMRRRRIVTPKSVQSAVETVQSTLEDPTFIRQTAQVRSVVVEECGSLWEKVCRLTKWALPEQTMVGMIANKVCSQDFLEYQNGAPEDTVIMNHVDSCAHVDDDAEACIYDGICIYCHDLECTCDPDVVARLVGKARFDPPEWENEVDHFFNLRGLYADVLGCKNRPRKGRLVRQQVRKWVGQIRERKALEVSRMALTNNLEEGGMRMKNFSLFQRVFYGDRNQVPPLTETSGWFSNRRDPAVLQRGLSLLKENSRLYAKLKLMSFGMTAKCRMSEADKATLVYKVQVVLTKEIDKGKLSYETGLELMPVMIQALSSDTKNQTMIPHMLGTHC